MKLSIRSLILSLFFVGFLFSCGNSKKELLAKKWKVTELDLSGTKLTGDQINITYDFNPDGTFYKTEDGKTQDGNWKLTEADTLILSPKNQDSKIERKIETLTPEKLVISGQEFSMQRTLTLEPIE